MNEVVLRVVVDVEGEEVIAAVDPEPADKPRIEEAGEVDTSAVSGVTDVVGADVAKECCSVDPELRPYEP